MTGSKVQEGALGQDQPEIVLTVSRRPRVGRRMVVSKVGKPRKKGAGMSARRPLMAEWRGFRSGTLTWRWEWWGNEDGELAWKIYVYSFSKDVSSFLILGPWNCLWTVRFMMWCISGRCDYHFIVSLQCNLFLGEMIRGGFPAEGNESFGLPPKNFTLAVFFKHIESSGVFPWKDRLYSVEFISVQISSVDLSTEMMSVTRQSLYFRRTQIYHRKNIN
jgi:hypothetical protein